MTTRNFLSGLLEMMARGGGGQLVPLTSPPQQALRFTAPPTVEEEEELAYQRFLEQTYSQEEVQRRQHPFLMAQMGTMDPEKAAQVNAARDYLESQGVETTSQFPSEQWLTETGLVEPRAPVTPPEEYDLGTPTTGPDLSPKGPVRDFLGKALNYVSPEDAFKPPFMPEQVLGTMGNIFNPLSEMISQELWPTLSSPSSSWGDIRGVEGPIPQQQLYDIQRAQSLPFGKDWVKEVTPDDPLHMPPTPTQKLIDWELEKRAGPDMSTIHGQVSDDYRGFLPGGPKVNRMLFGSGGLWDFDPSPEPGQPWLTSPYREAAERALSLPPGLRLVTDLYTEVAATAPVPYYGFTNLPSRGFTRVAGTGPLGDWGADLLKPSTGYGLGELPTPFLGLGRTGLGRGPAPTADSGMMGQVLGIGRVGGIHAPWETPGQFSSDDLQAQMQRAYEDPEGKLALASPEERARVEEELFLDPRPGYGPQAYGPGGHRYVPTGTPLEGPSGFGRPEDDIPDWTLTAVRQALTEKGLSPENHDRLLLQHGGDITRNQGEVFFTPRDAEGNRLRIEQSTTERDKLRVSEVGPNAMEAIGLRRLDRSRKSVPPMFEDLFLGLRNSMAFYELGLLSPRVNVVDNLRQLVELNPTRGDLEIPTGGVSVNYDGPDWTLHTEAIIKNLLDGGVQAGRIRTAMQNHLRLPGVDSATNIRNNKVIDDLIDRSSTPAPRVEELTHDELLKMGGYTPGVEIRRTATGISPAGPYTTPHMEFRTDIAPFEMPEALKRRIDQAEADHVTRMAALDNLDNAIDSPPGTVPFERIVELEQAAQIELPRDPSSVSGLNFEEAKDLIQDKKRQSMSERTEAIFFEQQAYGQSSETEHAMQRRAHDRGVNVAWSRLRASTGRVQTTDPSAALLRDVGPGTDVYSTVHDVGPGTPDWARLGVGKKDEYRTEMAVIASDMIKELDKLRGSWDSMDLDPQMIAARTRIVQMFEDALKQWKAVNDEFQALGTAKWIRRDDYLVQNATKLQPSTRGGTERKGEWRRKRRDSMGPSVDEVDAMVLQALGVPSAVAGRRGTVKVGPILQDWFGPRGEASSFAGERALVEPAIDPLHPRLLSKDDDGNYVILQATNQQGTGPVGSGSLEWKFIQEIVELSPNWGLPGRARQSATAAGMSTHMFRYNVFTDMWKRDMAGLQKLYSEGLEVLQSRGINMDSNTFWAGDPEFRRGTGHRLVPVEQDRLFSGEEWWNKGSRGNSARWNLGDRSKESFIQFQKDAWAESQLPTDPDYVPPVGSQTAEEWLQSRTPDVEVPTTPDIPLDVKVTPTAAVRTGQPARIKTFRGAGYEGILGDARYSSIEKEDALKFYGPDVEEMDIILRNPLVISKDEQWANLLTESGVGQSYLGPKIRLRENEGLTIRDRELGYTTVEGLNAAKVAHLREYLDRQGYDGLVIKMPVDRNPQDLFTRPTRGQYALDPDTRFLREDFGSAQVIEFSPSRTLPAQPEDIPSLSRPREREVPGDTWQEKADNLPNVVKRLLGRSGRGGRAQLSRAEQEELRDFLLEHGKVHPDNGAIKEDFGGRLSFYLGYFDIGSPGGMHEGYVVWSPGTGGGPNEFGIHMTAPDPRDVSRARNKAQSKAYGEPTDEAYETLEIFGITEEFSIGDPALPSPEVPRDTLTGVPEDLQPLGVRRITTDPPASVADEPAIVIEDDGSITVNDPDAYETSRQVDEVDIDTPDVIEEEWTPQGSETKSEREVQVRQNLRSLNTSRNIEGEKIRQLRAEGTDPEELAKLEKEYAESYQAVQAYTEELNALVNKDVERLADIDNQYLTQDSEGNIAISSMPNDIEWVEGIPRGMRSNLKDIDRARMINEVRDRDAKLSGWEGYTAAERAVRVRAGLEMPLGMTDEEKSFVLRGATNISFNMDNILGRAYDGIDTLTSRQAQRQMEGLDLDRRDDLALERYDELTKHAHHVKSNADRIRENPGQHHLYIDSTRARAKLVQELDNGEITLDEFRSQMVDVEADEYAVGLDHILRQNTTGNAPPMGGGPHGESGPGGIWDDDGNLTSLLARAHAHRLENETLPAAILRLHQAIISNQERQSTIHMQRGIQKLRLAGIGKEIKGQLVLRGGTDDMDRMDALFEALHNQSKVDAGEIEVEPALQEIYEDLRHLTDFEQDARTDFDTATALVEDYFYRGWKPPEGLRKTVVDSSGKLVWTPAFKRPRRNATYREMRDLGWEPLHWNPYQQWKTSRMQGVNYRQQMQLVEVLRQSKLARPNRSNIENHFEGENWRVPRVGPAFEGKPYRTATGEQGRSLQWLVKNSTADRLEAMYGKTPEFSIAKIEAIVNWLTFVPKQAKLFFSFFQHVDFLNRVGHAAWTRLLTDMEELAYIDKRQNIRLRKRLKSEALKKEAWANLGKSAAGATVLLPYNMAKIIGRGYRADWRIGIKEAFDDTTPLIEGRPDVNMYNISRAGLNYTDPTIFRVDFDKLAKDVYNESGLSKAIKFPFRLVGDLDYNMRQGLFEGAYPMAQIIDIQNYMAQSMAKLYPHLTDAQLNSMIATQANMAYSTIPASQSIVQNRFIRSFLTRMMFSMGESEALLRQAFDATGLTRAIPGKGTKVSYPSAGKYWRRRAIGAYMYMAVLANIIHFVSTTEINEDGITPGRALPLNRMYKLFEANPYALFNLGYNPDFLSPDLWRTKDGNQVSLDLMGQMDTAFRILDPIQFLESREQVFVRGISEQIAGEDFYGQPINQVGPVDGILSRSATLARTMFAPIGVGEGAANIMISKIPALQDEESWAYGLIQPGEMRLDTAGHIVQSTGMNVRSQNFFKKTNELAMDNFGKDYKDLEPIFQDMIKAHSEVQALGMRDHTDTADMLKAKEEYLNDLRTLAADPKNKNKNFNRITAQIHFSGVKEGLMQGKGEDWDNNKKLNSPDKILKAIAQYYSVFSHPAFEAETSPDERERVRNRLEAEFKWDTAQRAAVDRHRSSRLPIPESLVRELGRWGSEWSRSLQDNIAHAKRQGASEKLLNDYRAYMLDKDTATEPLESVLTEFERSGGRYWWEEGGTTEEKAEAGLPYRGAGGVDRPPQAPDPMVPNWVPGPTWPAPGPWDYPEVSPAPVRRGPSIDNSPMTPLYDTPITPRYR